MIRFVSALSLALAALLIVGATTVGAKPKWHKKTFDAYAVVDSAGFVDNGPEGNSLGDTLVATQKLYKDETMSRQIGTDEFYCVRTVADAASAGLCTGIFYLRGGQITITGPEGLGLHSLAITGGTGKWRGVRGEVVLNSQTPASDQMTFHVTR
jgi:allene oxide cyclase